MPDSVATLRPNGTVTAGPMTPTGAASVDAATSDNSDSTYVTASSGATATVDLTTFTVPALAFVRYLTVRVRAADGSVANDFVNTWLWDPTSGVLVVAGASPFLTASPTTYVLRSFAAAPNGRPWTQAAIDGLQVRFAIGQPVTGGVYELYVDVLYNQAPTAVIASVGPASTLAPTVTVDYADPEADRMERYWVKAFTQPEADPEHPATVAAWDSGEVIAGCDAGASFAVPVPPVLSNWRTYYFYAKVADSGSGGRYGAWTGATTFQPQTFPAAAAVHAVPAPDSALAAVDNLNVQARQNLLSLDESTFEAGFGSWFVGSNCTRAISADHNQRGTHSLKVTAAADGDMWVTVRAATQPGELYTALASAFPGSTARAVRVFLNFDNSGVVQLGSTVYGGTEVAGARLTLWGQARSPAAAAYAEMTVQWLACAAGEDHYLDCAAIAAATSNPLQNSDFDELDVLWTLTSGGGGSASVVQAGGSVGKFSVLLNRVDSNVATAKTPYFLAVEPDEVLVVSALFFLSSTNGVSYQATLELVGPDEVAIGQALISDLPVGAWVRRSFVITVPAAKTSGYLIASAGDRFTSTSLATVYVDALQVERIGAGFVNGGFETAVGGASVTREDGLDGVGWVCSAYPALVVSDLATFHSGLRSLRLGGDAGDVAAGTWNVMEQDFPVAGRATVDVDYWWKLSNVEQAHAKLTFLDGARLPILPITSLGPSLPPGATTDGRSVFMPPGTDSAATTGWLHQTFAGVPVPGGAVWANLSLLAGRSYDQVNAGYAWFDDIAVAVHGTATWSEYMPGGWTVGGLTNVAVTLERSADDGFTWAPVRWPIAGRYLLAPGGLAELTSPYRTFTVDYEAERAWPVLYRSAMAAADGANLITSPVWQRRVGVTLPADSDCLKDPSDPARNIIDLCVEAGVASSSAERQVVGEPFGRPEYTVPPVTVRGEVLALSLAFGSDAEWAAFETLRGVTPPGGEVQMPRVLLLQLRYGDGTAGPAEQYYVRLGPDRAATRLTSPDMAIAQKRLASVPARQVRPPA